MVSCVGVNRNQFDVLDKDLNVRCFFLTIC